MCNDNGNKFKDIKNNKKTCKTSLPISILNKQNEKKKIQIKRIQAKQSQTDLRQLIH